VKIHLFIPCLVDQYAAATAHATTKLFTRLGHEVIYDSRQTCCGQAPFNAGFHREARRLAERFIHIFREAEVVVAPGGSCVSMVKRHYAELDLDQAYRPDWEALKERVWELCSFIVDRLALTDVGAYFPHRVTYHASCHLLRELSVREQPLKLLRNVKGLELIEGVWGDECCGFGGAFSVKYPELSRRIADRRAGRLASGGAEYITGADDSCLNNLDGALRRIGAPQQTIHIARILASENGTRA
jgi:L-lactate dehydrogenase complex protein LldE